MPQPSKSRPAPFDVAEYGLPPVSTPDVEPADRRLSGLWVPTDGRPVCSLGYQVADWIERYIRSPDHEGSPPIRLIGLQKDFIVELYALDPETRRRLIRRAVLRAAKGLGKGPTAAMLCVAELCGPVVFDGFDAGGQPVGVARVNPNIAISAYSEDATAQTFAWLYQSLQASWELCEDYGIKVGMLDVKFRDKAQGGIIKPVTSSAGALEGKGTHFAVCDELHHWTAPRHKSLYKVHGRNTAKVGGVTLGTTNAHGLGQGSVGELEEDSHKEGQPGLLYFSQEPAEPVDYDVKDPENEARLRIDLDDVYGDSLDVNGGWVPLERLIEEIYDKSLPASDVLRFYLNTSSTGADAYLTYADWELTELADAVPAPGTDIVLGFDGSKDDDHTVLLGMTLGDGAQVLPHLFVVEHWFQPEDWPEDGPPWEVPRDEVRGLIVETFDTYRVRLMFADPPHFTEMLDALAIQFGSDVVVKVFTNTQYRVMTNAINLFQESIQSATITHDNHGALTKQCLAAQVTKRGGSSGYKTLSKPRYDSKIDLCVGAVLARAALGSLMMGEAKKPKKRKAKSYGTL